jgi:hypothetical protein
LARIISAFLSSLLTSYSQILGDNSAEILNFCLSFSNVKEATALYSAVKALTSG